MTTLVFPSCPGWPPFQSILLLRDVYWSSLEQVNLNLQDISSAANVSQTFSKLSKCFKTFQMFLKRFQNFPMYSADAAIVGKKRDLGILDPMIFSCKIRKNAPKIRKNTEQSEKYYANQEKYVKFGQIFRQIRKNAPENQEKYSRKLGKILPKNQDPGVKITFSNYDSTMMMVIGQ